jgi:hypothetical protein
VGSAAMKWNSDVSLGATGNVWKNAALTPYDAQGSLDFYQIHYYGWMNGDGVNWSYAPTLIDWAKAGFDKPVVIGELPANASGTNYSVAGMLDKLHSNCYAGAWAWSYAGVDGAGTWSDIAAAMKAFNTTYASEVNVVTGGAPQPSATAVPPSATAIPAAPTAIPPTAVPPTATPAPIPPAPASAQGIFTDSLAAGWQNWSWSSTVQTSTGRFKTGKASLAITLKAAWAGFYIHNNTPLNTKGYTKIRLWINGGTTGGQKLMLWTRDSGGKASPQLIIPAPTTGWSLVQVTLAQLGSPATISELVIQDAQGAAQKVFYVDQIELAK